ncbi:MAG: K+-dependent Na+/Ca+ exchanger related-protein [Moraxellaceae bacterium]|jgi:cation:H+ antiporter|nr:K+-dependent Na+/Ca+ exchanger related-protein [Moraxellaceae bacterium]
MSDALYLFIGVLCAAIGGELFVRGIVGMAQWARIAPAIVAATVAAFATSSPELSVAINAASAGHPAIALGDALGSNVVNIALILGIVLLIAEMRSSRDSLRRDFPTALVVPGVMAILLLDGLLSRFDAVLMLGLFLLWLRASAQAALRHRDVEAAEAVPHGAVIVLCAGAGLALLVGAGYLIVTGASGLATTLGMDPFLVGALVVAAGTSTPELVTALVARLRGHADVSLGTLLGSNIFNGLFIVPVAVLIHPINVPVSAVKASLLFGLVATVLVYPVGDGILGRRRGLALLATYAAFVVVLLQG